MAADHVCAKECPLCKAGLTLEQLCESPEVESLGLMLDEEDPKFSLFFFNHLPTRCQTTFTVPIETFASLIQEPVPGECKAFTEACEQHCVSLDDHEACKQECSNAPYRRLLAEVLLPRRKVRAA